MNILDKIVLQKQKEIAEKKKAVPLTKENINFVKKSNFLTAITQQRVGDIGLIAEIKMQSPSAGKLGEISEIIPKVKEYEKAGADAISVVTDETFFGGSLKLFDTIKEAVSIPVFRKDFVIDDYQIYESAMHGADALLLIARIVSTETLKEFVQLSYDVGIEPVVEIYDEVDLEKALQSGAKAIAVNARDLQTFAIDILAACELGKKIPKEKVFIGFSGVSNRADVEVYKNSGAKAVLVGTQLMKSENIEKMIRDLKFTANQPQ